MDKARNCDFKWHRGRGEDDDRLHIAGVELIERCQHLTIKVHCSGTAHDRCQDEDKRIGMALSCGSDRDRLHGPAFVDLAEAGAGDRGADVHHELKSLFVRSHSTMQNSVFARQDEIYLKINSIVRGLHQE